MRIVIFLLCVSLLVAMVFLVAFIWNVKNGQYEDDYSPAHRILFEDKQPISKNKLKTKE